MRRIMIMFRRFEMMRACNTLFFVRAAVQLRTTLIAEELPIRAPMQITSRSVSVCVFLSEGGAKAELTSTTTIY
jgi:hypothetical protein